MDDRRQSSSSLAKFIKYSIRDKNSGIARRKPLLRKVAGLEVPEEVSLIEVRRISQSGSLDVVVREGEGETRHRITISRETYERLSAGKHTPERCLEAAFRFLLDREPKESILGRFDVTVISRYFPEFEQELSRYLSRS